MPDIINDRDLCEESRFLFAYLTFQILMIIVTKKCFILSMIVIL